MANFPTSVPSLKTDYTDNVDDVMADNQNEPNGEINAIGDFIGANGASLFTNRPAKTTLNDSDVMGLNDAAASNVLKKITWANIKAALKSYFDGFYSTPDGWFAAGETWTYASADDPTFTFTISGDKTSKYSAGMRIKLTQTTTKYFIITKVEYSAPNTTVTIYGGTDYDLANAAISDPYYSVQKAPFGFPLDPTKWTVEVSDTSTRSQANPTQGVWYNLGTTNSQIIIPIGVWRVGYRVSGFITRDSAAELAQYVTLSTANNSNSDPRFCIRNYNNAGNVALLTPFTISDVTLALTAKTTYYLNSMTDVIGISNIYYFNNSDIPMTIRAICAYL